MAHPRQKYVFYNLRETYHELGEYDFKIVLDPRSFRNGHLSEISCVDSDGKPMTFDIQKWGRKINCKFTVDNKVSDGVSIMKMNLKDDQGHECSGTKTFWIIKP